MIVYPKILKVYIPGVETILVRENEGITFKAEFGGITSHIGSVQMTAHAAPQEGEVNLGIGLRVIIDKRGIGTVFCDRCKEKCGQEGNLGITSGYYEIANCWGRFSNPGEAQVCDHCMWHDSRYRAQYGKNQCHCKKCKCDCAP